jgi:hypothetical protein
MDFAALAPLLAMGRWRERGKSTAGFWQIGRYGRLLIPIPNRLASLQAPKGGSLYLHSARMSRQGATPNQN